MKTQLLNATARVLAPVLISALTLGPLGCSGNASGGGDGTPANGGVAGSGVTARYDGETVFRGFFLGTGPVAEQLPELRDPALALSSRQLTKEQLATQLEGAAGRMRVEGKAGDAAGHIDRLVADLRAGSTTPEELLLARQNVETTSGDRIIARINAVDPTFLTRFAADFQSGDHVRIQRAIDEGGRLFLDAASVEGALPGHVVPEARCIAVFVVAILVFFVFAIHGGGTVGELQRAQLVDTIATRFAN